MERRERGRKAHREKMRKLWASDSPCTPWIYSKGHVTCNRDDTRKKMRSMRSQLQKPNSSCSFLSQRKYVGPFLNELDHFLVLLLSARIKHHEKFCTEADFAQACGTWHPPVCCRHKCMGHFPGFPGPLTAIWTLQKNALPSPLSFQPLLVSPPNPLPPFAITCAQIHLPELETRSHCLPLQSIEIGREGNLPTWSPH